MATISKADAGLHSAIRSLMLDCQVALSNRAPAASDTLHSQCTLAVHHLEHDISWRLTSFGVLYRSRSAALDQRDFTDICTLLAAASRSRNFVTPRTLLSRSMVARQITARWLRLCYPFCTPAPQTTSDTPGEACFESWADL